MTDSPKPITPEFVRGYKQAACYAALRGDGDVAKVILEATPLVDDLAAAKERLGAWLVEDDGRRWSAPEVVLCEDGAERFMCMLFLDREGMRRPLDGLGATPAEAINAALDAAERSEKP